MNSTTLLFRTSHAPLGGERDFVAALLSTVVTPELALECARPIIEFSDCCRIGVMNVTEGQAITQGSWRVQRYLRFEDMPTGTFFEHLPGTVRDVVDDMDLEITLAPWVAVFRE